MAKKSALSQILEKLPTAFPFENFLSSSGFDCSNLHVNQLKLLVPTPEKELPDSADVNISSTWFSILVLMVFNS